MTGSRPDSGGAAPVYDMGDVQQLDRLEQVIRFANGLPSLDSEQWVEERVRLEAIEADSVTAPIELALLYSATAAPFRDLSQARQILRQYNDVGADRPQTLRDFARMLYGLLQQTADQVKLLEEAECALVLLEETQRALVAERRQREQLADKLDALRQIEKTIKSRDQGMDEIGR